MKLCICLSLFVFTASAIGQTGALAIPTYTKNDKLVSLTNLSGLSDCATRTALGKVANVDIDGSVARVRLSEKKESMMVEIPLDRLPADVRGAIFKQLVRKKIKL